MSERQTFNQCSGFILNQIAILPLYLRCSWCSHVFKMLLFVFGCFSLVWFGLLGRQAERWHIIDGHRRCMHRRYKENQAEEIKIPLRIIFFPQEIQTAGVQIEKSIICFFCWCSRHFCTRTNKITSQISFDNLVNISLYKRPLIYDSNLFYFMRSKNQSHIHPTIHTMQMYHADESNEIRLKHIIYRFIVFHLYKKVDNSANIQQQ